MKTYERLASIVQNRSGDVDAAYREVEASGVGIARALQTENWGARGFNLVDPSGNLVHVEQA